jgi:hypothetical protein
VRIAGEVNDCVAARNVGITTATCFGDAKMIGYFSGVIVRPLQRAGPQ